MAAKENIDVYGFERDDDFDYESYETFMSEYLAILTRRLIKWQKMLSLPLNKSRKLKRYVRKGIPSEMRRDVWINISLAIQENNINKKKYEEYLISSKLSKTDKDGIKADVRRTYPENIYFRELDGSLLNPLSNILTAYACHNPVIGYCQGLNYIAGLLLLVTKNETDSFWLLCQLLDQLLPDFYSSKMSGLRIECHVLELLIESHHVDLHRHLQRHNIDMELVVAKWFICLFMDVLPIETVLRLWDCLFYEGSKILLRAAYTLIIFNKKKFMAKDSFTEICSLFKEITKDEIALNCHFFMKLCFTLPESISRAKIKKLRVQAANMIQVDE